MKWLIATVTMLMLAGCGSVDWFPENSGSSTAPNAFSFTAKTDQPINSTVQSNSVTVTGTNANGWTVSVSGATGSQYSINGAAFTSTPGIILPNQNLVVQHTTPGINSTVSTTTVTVGTYTTTFQSTTVAATI